jgi:hypothetical protein
LFFFKSYVASYGYVCRPGTDRIPEGVPKKFLRNRNRDSCEKSATGEENTGILRIPAGITNLDRHHDPSRPPASSDSKLIGECDLSTSYSGARSLLHGDVLLKGKLTCFFFNIQLF